MSLPCCDSLLSTVFFFFSLILLLYILLSKFFLYYPGLLHKPKPPSRKLFCELIAHRGSRREGLPENSKAAFQDAIEKGAHIIELDVWESRDRKVIVHHDECFSRMTAGRDTRKVTEVEYADYPSIIPSEEQCERVSSWKGGNCSVIPLFEEVLAALPEDVFLIIEFKQDSDSLIESVWNTLKSHNRLDGVYWFSLIERINCKLRRADNRICTIVSVPGVLKTLALYYSGLLPFVSFEDRVFGVTVEEVTLETLYHEPALSSLPRPVIRLLSVFLIGKPPRFMMAPELFAHMRKRGVPVWFLGVDTEEELLLAVRSGATAVLTDRIGWLADTVRKENLKFSKIEA